TATRNRLAEKANYNWLLFLDADVIPKYKDFIERFISKKNKQTSFLAESPIQKQSPNPTKCLDGNTAMRENL
ncbi:MAG TPA: hypothetical protein DEG69_00350, partial [Flavobacteriaceae bacterium]|nr:hypothetical protein [Flavobacteriaceae bacterium]